MKTAKKTAAKKVAGKKVAVKKASPTPGAGYGAPAQPAYKTGGMTNPNKPAKVSPSAKYGGSKTKSK